MNLKNFKKYLEEKDDEFLRDEILTLYKTFEVVREYYDFRIEPQSIDEIIQKYKAILEEQFCPARGFPELKYSIARKAISDFKKVCRDPVAIIDLQLTYVEYGVKCTLQYGDIDERFYSSMESMFRTSLEADPYTQVNIHNLKALPLTCLAIVYNPSKLFATQAPHLICAL